MAAGKEPTIIIKKIKKVSGGHHGGAWKVAYADFVTAMMAFFLLLWLLSSTSEAQKEGIADYFTPTTAIGSGTGMGSGGGTTSTDGTDKSDKSTVAVIKGGTPAGPGKNTKDTIIDADLEQAEFDKTQEQIKQAMEELQDELAQNVLIKITPEGLQIDVVDSDKHPMFNPGTPNLSPFGQDVLTKISKVIERLPNYIAISGHTDAEVLNARGGSYTNWELSSERANTARRFINTKSIDEERIMRVQGRAATELLKPEDPLSPTNRRVTLLLLRGDHWKGSSYQQNTPGSLISAPKVNEGLLRREKPKQ